MRKPEGPDTTPQAVQACHELILWMIPQFDKFPRVRRFTPGERLESTLLLVLRALWLLPKVFRLVVGLFRRVFGEKAA